MPLAKDPHYEEAASFVESLGKAGETSCGLIVFQADGFLQHRDSFGWKQADETNTRTRSLINARAKEYGGAVFGSEHSVHPEYLVVCPNAILAKQLAKDIYQDFGNLNIQTVDYSYFKEYPSIPPLGNLKLTTSVLLIDRILLIGPTYRRIIKVMVLHEMCQFERTGKITVLDLTESNENT